MSSIVKNLKQLISNVRSENARLSLHDPWDLNTISAEIYDIIARIGDTSKLVTTGLLPHTLLPFSLDEWNEFIAKLNVDIKSLFAAANYLESISTNVIVASDSLTEWLNKFAVERRIYSDMKTVTRLSKQRVYENPHLKRDLVYSTTCRIDDEIPAAICKPISYDYWKPSSIVLGPRCNGQPGKRYAKWETSSIEDIFDGDIETWFEYEKVIHVTEKTEPLLLDLVITRDIPATVNKMNLDFSMPYGKPPVIESIQLSEDGKTFITVASNLVISTSGKISVRFLPIDVKVIEITIRQDSYMPIDIEGDNYIRYAILLREIEVAAERSQTSGELILGPFSCGSDDDIGFVTLDGVINGNISASMSADTVFRWKPVKFPGTTLINDPIDNIYKEPGTINNIMLKLDIDTSESAYPGKRKSITHSITSGDITINTGEKIIPGTTKASVNAVAVIGDNKGVVIGNASGETNLVIKLPQWLQLMDGTVSVGGKTWTQVPFMSHSSDDQVYIFRRHEGSIHFGDGKNGAIPIGEVRFIIPSVKLDIDKSRPYIARLPLPSDGSKKNTEIQVKGIPKKIINKRIPAGVTTFSLGKENIVQSSSVTLNVPSNLNSFSFGDIPINVQDIIWSDKSIFSRFVTSEDELSTSGDWTAYIDYARGFTRIKTYDITREESKSTATFDSRGYFNQKIYGFTRDASFAYVHVLPITKTITLEDGSKTTTYLPPCEHARTREGDKGTKKEYYCPLTLRQNQIIILPRPIRIGKHEDKANIISNGETPRIMPGTTIRLKSYPSSGDGNLLTDQTTKIISIESILTYDGFYVQVATLSDNLKFRYADNKSPELILREQVLTCPQFSNTTVFRNETLYVDGKSELSVSGDYSINYDTGTVSTFVPTDNTTSVSYWYSDKLILDDSEWNFANDDYSKIEIEHLRTGKSSMGFAIDITGKCYLIPSSTRKSYIPIPFNREYDSNPTSSYRVPGYGEIIPEVDILRGEFVTPGKKQFTVNAKYIVEGSFSIVPVFSNKICTRSIDRSINNNKIVRQVNKCSLGHSYYASGESGSGYYEPYCSDPVGRVTGSGCKHYLPPASKVTSLFRRERKYVDGYSELTSLGDYSIDYDSGTVCVFDYIPNGLVVQYGGNRYTCKYVANVGIDDDYITSSSNEITISRSFLDVHGITDFPGKQIVISYLPEGTGKSIDTTLKSPILREFTVIVGGRNV